MQRVENYRDFKLYQRSMDLVNLIYNVTSFYEGGLTDREVRLIRKKLVIIPIQIASAITQGNIKIRFKNLNEAKATLTQLRTIIMELNKRKKVDDYSWKGIEGSSIEVLKLFHGYFGWLKMQK